MRVMLMSLAMIAFLGGTAALAQSPSSPSGDAQSQPGNSGAPPIASVKGYAVSVAPDAGTSMAAQGSGPATPSPSNTPSPSSPMANPSGWPAMHKSDKRPKWVKKAPPATSVEPPASDARNPKVHR